MRSSVWPARMRLLRHWRPSAPRCIRSADCTNCRTQSVVARSARLVWPGLRCCYSKRRCGWKGPGYRCRETFRRLFGGLERVDPTLEAATFVG
jgi:hypothetical protein